MIGDDLITRDEGLSHADSPTNLMWRLQNDQTPIARAPAKSEDPDTAFFTEIALDVVGGDAPNSRSAPLTRR